MKVVRATPPPDVGGGSVVAALGRGVGEVVLRGGPIAAVELNRS